MTIKKNFATCLFSKNNQQKRIFIGLHKTMRRFVTFHALAKNISVYFKCIHHTKEPYEKCY